MEGKHIRKYRENIELSQNNLSEQTHIAQNTLSQYENDRRMVDNATKEHLLQHLRVASISQHYQMTNQLVRAITESILEEDALAYWTSEVKVEPTNAGDNVLLNGGTILVYPSDTNEDALPLTLENLFLGFKQWLTRSADYVQEQVVSKENGEITMIDEIGVNEICQYALFNDLLCDLPQKTN